LGGVPIHGTFDKIGEFIVYRIEADLNTRVPGTAWFTPRPDWTLFAGSARGLRAFLPSHFQSLGTDLDTRLVAACEPSVEATTWLRLPAVLELVRSLGSGEAFELDPAGGSLWWTTRASWEAGFRSFVTARASALAAAVRACSDVPSTGVAAELPSSIEA
jgi:hypothetical protein